MITAISTGAVYCYSPLAAQLGFWCWVNSVTTHHQAEQSTLGGGGMQAVCHLHRTAGLRVDIQDNPCSCISQRRTLTFCWGMMIFSSKVKSCVFSFHYCLVETREWGEGGLNRNASHENRTLLLSFTLPLPYIFTSISASTISLNYLPENPEDGLSLWSVRSRT